LLRGGELSKMMGAEPGWYLDRTLEQVGLAYAKGVVHGDLSEYNVFVSDEGAMRV
jgi:RIO kinase 2